MAMRALKTRIMFSHMAVIVLLSVSIAVVGFYFIKKDILDKAQVKVKHDLNSARAVYKQEIKDVGNIVHFTAVRFFLKDAIVSDDMETLKSQLEEIRASESLDILTLTDKDGRVKVRAGNPTIIGDSQVEDELVSRVLSEEKTVRGTEIISEKELLKESPRLVEQAYMEFVPTPKARPANEEKQTLAMCIKAAAPVFDYNNKLIGVLYGGNLLNKNYGIVDRAKEIVYQGLKYKGKDVGTVTIFQEDLRISTNVMDAYGKRAIGTRVSEDVYNQVILKGLPWTDRAFVVSDWYKTAYEPIKDINGQIIGMLYVGTLEQPFNDIAKNIMLIFLLIIMLATLLGSVLSAVLAGHISRPLTCVADGATKLSGGELGTLVECKTSSRELSVLAESFNEMSAKLNEREKRLKTLNKNYVDLIGFVAHELRGILASAVMNSYAVRDGFLGLVNFKQQKAIDSVTRNLDYLTAVVGKFLNLGRIERGDLDIHKSEINISEDVFAVSISSLLPLAERKGIKVDNKIGSGLRLNADLDLMQIVANNLIGNAIKYGDENGDVTVSGREIDGQVEIDVYNDSEPISEDQKEKLFIRFSRLKGAVDKKIKGTGLGLYITKQIIEGHSGKIWVEPREKGNSFIFKIEKGL